MLATSLLHPPRPRFRRGSYAPAVPVTFGQARDQFRRQARTLGARLESFAVGSRGPEGEELAFDAAWLGCDRPRRLLIVSTGVHGAEGFFGSAVQQCFLEEELRGATLPDDGALLFLHGLNPYGFAWRRRFNEANIDLNRNFLLEGQKYAGCPPLYPALLRLFPMNVKPQPRNFMLLGKVAYVLMRHGSRELRKNIPVGQYDHPEGPFFGGHGPSATQRHLAEAMPRWLAGVQEVAHLDFHTGLGPFGSHKLLIEEDTNEPSGRWWLKWFLTDEVEACISARTAYPTRGAFGPWCQSHLPNGDYRFATAEFGTYPPMRVLAAILAENRAYWCGLQQHPEYEWTRKRLMDVFLPTDEYWRDQCVRQGLEIIQRTWLGLFKTV